MSLLEMPQLWKGGITGIPFAAVLLLPASQASAQTARTEYQTQLSRAEAEILVYLMPVSKQLRTRGFDVGWEVREGKDSFHFFVYNTKRKCKDGCSVTVGYYTVNVLTAIVTDDELNKVVSNQEMRGVQGILRRAHHLP
jgi:hypothetical protein